MGRIQVPSSFFRVRLWVLAFLFSFVVGKTTAYEVVAGEEEHEAYSSPEVTVGVSSKGRSRNAYATMMYMGTPRDYEFCVATRVLIRSLSRLHVDADLVVIASKDAPLRWVHALCPLK